MAAGIEPLYYQALFAPAVAKVCRGAFVNFDLNFIPKPLDDFLHTRRDAISCADLGPLQITPAHHVQQSMRYLMLSVASMWSPARLSWRALMPLFGLFYAATALLAYILLRSAAGRAVALALSLAFIISPTQLDALPHLRDYAKAPFFLAVFVITAALVARRGRHLLIVASLSYGLVLGVAIGFRPDLTITIPLFLATLFLFTPGRLRDDLPLKAGAVLVAAAAFLVAGWPILRAERPETAGFFVLDHGFSLPFDRALGVETPSYNRGTLYVDTYLRNLAQAHLRRTTGSEELLVDGEPSFDRASRSYFFATVRLFPGDLLTRGLSALVQILDLPFTPRMEQPFAYDRGGAVIYAIRERLAAVGQGWGFWLALAAILVATVRSRKHGLFVASLIVFVAAYPALQFDPRHFFHLEIVGLWVLAYVLQAVLDRVWRQPAMTRAAFKRAGLGMAGCAAACLLLLIAARGFQARRLRTLFDTVAASARLPVMLIEGQSSGDLVLLQPPEPFPSITLRSPDGTVSKPHRDEYLLVDFDLSRAPLNAVRVTFRYEAQREIGYDPSYTVDLDKANGTRCRLLIEVTETGPETAFRGIELPRAALPALVRTERLASLSGLPLLPNAVFRSGLDTPLYERLRRWPVNPVDSLMHGLVSQPRTRLFQRFGDWLLIGLDDPPDGPLRLVWEAPPGVTVAAGAGLRHQAGRRYIQTLPHTMSLVAALRDLGAPADLVTLAAGRSLQSPPLPVWDDAVYLQSVETRGEGGDAYGGVIWRPGDAVDWVAAGLTPRHWTRSAKLMAAIPAGDAATFELLNFRQEGSASFRAPRFVLVGQENRVPCSSRCGPPLLPLTAADTRIGPPGSLPLRGSVNGWRLDGFDADEEALASGRPTDIALHWLAPLGVRPPQTTDFRRAAGRSWVQTIRGARNLIDGGDFESGSLIEGPDPYGAAPSAHAVESTLRDGRATHVAVLRNGPGVEQTGIHTASIRVGPGRFYLQSGWMQTPGSGAFIGRIWLPPGAITYAAAGATAPRWQAARQLIQVPPDALWTQVMLLDYQSKEPVRFDNAVLVDLGVPNRCATCGVPLVPGPPIVQLPIGAAQRPRLNAYRKVETGWTLEGATVGAGDILLFWVPPEGVGVTETPGFTPTADGRWLQHVPRRNVIPDAALAAKAGFFPLDIYGAGDTARQFGFESIGGRATPVASLTNTDIRRSSGYVSRSLAVSAAHLYLQRAWFQTSGGSAFIGWHLLPSGENVYIAAGAAAPRWTEVAGVLQPTPGTTSADLWLLNYDSPGKVSFAAPELFDLGTLTPKCSSRCGPPLKVE